jgi:hypothetical protein
MLSNSQGEASGCTTVTQATSGGGATAGSVYESWYYKSILSIANRIISTYFSRTNYRL